jgi:hypothetical protein
VFWPVVCDFDITLDNKPATTIAMMESIKPGSNSTQDIIVDYHRKVGSLIRCISNKPEKLLPKNESMMHSSTISRILSLCLREEEATSILNIMNEKQIGQLTADLIHSLVHIQQQFHLNTFRDNFLALIHRNSSILNIISFVDFSVSNYETVRPSALDDLEAAMFERIMKLSILSIDQAMGDAIVHYLVSHDKLAWTEAFAASFGKMSSINDQAWICASITTAHAAHSSSMVCIEILKKMVFDMLTSRYQQHEGRSFHALFAILSIIRQ